MTSSMNDSTASSPCSAGDNSNERSSGSLYLHAQHNSLVDFSFMKDLLSRNKITLTRLNVSARNIEKRIK